MNRARRGVAYFFDDFHPVFTGHSVYMQQIMKRLRERGCESTVICQNPSDLPSREVHDGIEIRRVPIPRSSKRGQLEFVRSLLEVTDRFTTLHVNGWPDPFGLLAGICHATGRRLVLQSTLFGGDDGHSYVRNHRGGPIRVWQLARAHAITAISRPLVQSYRDIGVPEQKLVYLPQGVDLSRFTPADPDDRRALREALRLPEHGPIAVFVGTIMHRKGIDLLVDAWTRVQRQVPDATLVLVGQADFGPENENQSRLNAYVEEIRATVARHDLRVRFAGLRDDVPAWYRVADAFVLPSRKEGFGNVIIEAMATRLPVVVTPMDGVAHETVEEGVNGFIVDDVDSMADRLIELLSDPERARAMGERGEERARRLFDLERIALRYEGLYFPGSTGVPS